MSALIVYVTTSSRKEAQRISRAIIHERLAACVTIVPEIHSQYWWKGKIESGRECLMMMKTFPSYFKRLSARIHQLHSYEVPEVLAIPVSRGSKPYLSWMKASLKKGRR